MRWFTLSLLLLLVACGGDTASPTAAPPDLPTSAAPALLETPAADGSPRQDGTSEDLGVPPTFTPVPTLVRNDALPTAPATAAPGTPIPLPEGAQLYTIKAGDTLAEIAADFGLSLDALAAANNITDINRIEVGDQLIIPQP